MTASAEPLHGEQVVPAPARKEYLPTLEEIAFATAEIREGWSDEDYRQRAGLAGKTVTIPEWNLAD